MSIYDNIEYLPAKMMGFNYYDSELFDELITRVKPETIIEVGTWLGGTAFTMCESIKKNKLKTKLYCVDTWLGSIEFIDKTYELLTDERNLMLKNGYPQVYYQFLNNVIHSGNQDIIIPVPNTSDIASRYFKNNGITANIVFIDGSHDEEDVFNDLANYYDIATDIIFGDDYGWQGVFNAVNRFGVKFTVVDDNFWIINKNG